MYCVRFGGHRANGSFKEARDELTGEPKPLKGKFCTQLKVCITLDLTERNKQQVARDKDLTSPVHL